MDRCRPKVIHTRIDLLQGDVVTQMDEEFATGKYQSLRDYHASHEKQGNEIIQANIKTLKSLFELLTQDQEMKHFTYFIFPGER